MKLRNALLITLLTSLANVASAGPANAPTSEKSNAQVTVAVNINEYDAVKKILSLYIEGARHGKSAVMKPAFHDSAIMNGGGQASRSKAARSRLCSNPSTTIRLRPT